MKPQHTTGIMKIQPLTTETPTEVHTRWLVRVLRPIDEKAAVLETIAVVEHEPDAHLYAAAPDLLKAAEAVLPYLDLMWPPEAPGNIRVQLAEELKKACKEARNVR